jgi:S1-C subfamily serine protease
MHKLFVILLIFFGAIISLNASAACKLDNDGINRCNAGYSNDYTPSTNNSYVPPNAYATSSGWKCISGYRKNGNSCVKFYIPSNAYASGSVWKCNFGYKKSGNSCIINSHIPPNAYASGSGWKCNSGYTKSGNSCVKNIYIPPNAYASGSGWKCNSGYTKSGNSCIKNPKDDKVYSAASGSGFAVTSDGYVITNYHVIEGCTDVKIHDKGKSILATLVTFDPNNDIALLKGDFKPKSFYPLSRETPKLLTEIYVAGHPFGNNISTSVKVTKGIVSSLTGIYNNFSNLQIDAAIQPGNSGGPIMNDKGNVIGVAVEKLNFAVILEEFDALPENVNFGVKSNVVINILESENIKLPSPNANTIPTNELGEMITDGTYYLSCWMTLAQIEKMQETKVMFKDLK